MSEFTPYSDRTQPFQPGAASIPYHGGEQTEMQMRQHEKNGLPESSYEENPLLGDFFSLEDKTTLLEKVRNLI